MLRIAPLGVIGRVAGPGFLGTAARDASSRLRQTTYSTAIRPNVTCSMKIALFLFAAASLIGPQFCMGQALTPVKLGRDSIPTVYAVITANRAGINTESHSEGQKLRIRLDSAALKSHPGARIAHGLVGGLVGTLAGLVIGGGIGAEIDSHGTGDATVPATPILAIYGGIAGLVAGLLVGAVWPVK